MSEPAMVEKRRRFGAKLDAAGTADQITLVWRGSTRWAAAVVIALFPLLFILDEAVDPPLSPVLPMLLVLVVFIVGLPFLYNEVAVRRLRKTPVAVRPARVIRYQLSARLALTAASIWFVIWLAMGA